MRTSQQAYLGVLCITCKMASFGLGCPGLDPGDVNITCTHSRLEKRFGPGIDCAEKVPIKTQAIFLNCPPGYTIVEDYTIITCKFPGNWDKDVFTCDEVSTTVSTTKSTVKKATTKATLNTTKPANTTKASTISTKATTKLPNTTTTTKLPGTNTTTPMSSSSGAITTTVVTTISATITTTANTAVTTIATSTANAATTAPPTTAPPPTTAAPTTTDTAPPTTTTPLTTTTPPSGTDATTTTTAPSTSVPVSTTTLAFANSTLDLLGYSLFNGSVYKKYVDNNIKTWENADAKCKSEGSHLACINGVDEMHYLNKLSGSDYYVGVNDSIKDGVLQCNDGTIPVNFAAYDANANRTAVPSWRQDRPNGGIVENCFAYEISAPGLNDILCTRDENKVIICERHI